MATFKVQKLVPNAVIPTRGTSGAAGYDLYSTDGVLHYWRCRHTYNSLKNSGAI